MAKKETEKNKSWFKRHKIMTGFLIVFILFFSLGLLGSIISPDDTNSSDGTSSSDDTASTNIPVDTSIRVSAVDLWAEYEMNEIRADSKYEGKELIVNGTVVELGKDIFNKPFIVFVSQWGGVQCKSKTSELEKIAELNVGDFITVQGKGDGFFVLHVGIKDCVIL